jgi:hypothetical protein
LTREVGALVAVAVAVFVLGYAVLDSLLKLLVVVLVLRVSPREDYVNLRLCELLLVGRRWWRRRRRRLWWWWWWWW